MNLNDNGIEFAHLGLDEYEKFENVVRAKAMAFFEKWVAGMDVHSKFVAGREARPDIVVDAQVHIYVANTKEGAASVLDRALEVVGIETNRRKEIINSYDMVNAGNLAATLLGFENRVQTGRMAPAPAPTTDKTSTTGSTPTYQSTELQMVAQNAPGHDCFRQPAPSKEHTPQDE